MAAMILENPALYIFRNGDNTNNLPDGPLVEKLGEHAPRHGTTASYNILSGERR